SIDSRLHVLISLQGDAPYGQSVERRHTTSGRNCYLDRTARVDVQPVKPGCGESRERRPLRHAPAGRFDLELRAVRDMCEGVSPWPDPTPARPTEVREPNPVSRSVGESERTLRQRSWNSCPATHAMKIGPRGRTGNPAC